MKHITKPDDDYQAAYLAECSRRKKLRKLQKKIYRMQAKSYLRLYIVTLGKYFKTMLSRDNSN